MTPRPAVRAAIIGLAGSRLSDAERELLWRCPPAGVILFARNCVDRVQLRELTRAVRATQPERRVPILIDQEGGRVMRLKPPEWRPLPAAAAIGALAARDLPAGREAAWLLGRLIAHDLDEVGIDIDCAPVIDIARPETTSAIGNRAFSADPAMVADLARKLADGLMAGGVTPVLKHLPGHGRARVDSHLALPVVEASRDELIATDLVPARLLSDLPLAMTAHLLYRAIDPDRPATLSAAVIGDLIRGAAGFRGLLLSDDLGMKALKGDPGSRAAAALAAGCDLAVACTGDLLESEAVLAVAPVLDAAKLAQLAAARPEPSANTFNPVAAETRLNELLGAAVA